MHDCHSLETMHGDFWHISAVEGLIYDQPLQKHYHSTVTCITHAEPGIPSDSKRSRMTFSRLEASFECNSMKPRNTSLMQTFLHTKLMSTNRITCDNCSRWARSGVESTSKPYSTCFACMMSCTNRFLTLFVRILINSF